jgi:hypothetical protein
MRVPSDGPLESVAQQQPSSSFFAYEIKDIFFLIKFFEKRIKMFRIGFLY